MHEGRWIACATNFHLVECSNEVGNCGGFHSEIALIIAMLQTGWSDNDHQLVLDYSPCSNCANAIVSSDLFRSVHYSNVTKHDRRGIKILLQSGIVCCHSNVEDFIG